MADDGNPVAASAAISKLVIASLPPAFLLVVLLNLTMMYMVLDTVKHASTQRLEILTTVIEQCLKK